MPILVSKFLFCSIFYPAHISDKVSKTNSQHKVVSLTHSGVFPQLLLMVIVSKY